MCSGGSDRGHCPNAVLKLCDCHSADSSGLAEDRCRWPFSSAKDIQKLLESQNLTLGDVVMRVYLGGDPAKGGKVDVAGARAGYSQFFGTKDQPNKPACTTVQVVLPEGVALSVGMPNYSKRTAMTLQVVEELCCHGEERCRKLSRLRSYVISSVGSPES